MLRFRQLTALHRFLCNGLALLAVAISSGPVAAQARDADVFYLDEVRKGQRGYGLSVFSGSEIERFEVEVLGVWENLQPKTSYVLARLEGHGLEKSGVIAGMSGSPVYVDGKLLGAVSFGWPFSNEAIAGITPVEHMRTMLAEPAAVPVTGTSALTAESLIKAEIGEADLRETLALLRPHRIGEASVAIEWATAGFGERVRSLLSEELGPIASAGSMAPMAQLALDSNGKGAADLQPGSAVAAVLVDGDFRLAATGTVTDRIGDSILAFGHPFLGIGPLAVPMAAAEVLTVVSSRLTSFKVANLGPVVGAVDFDYLTGIRGTLGHHAPVVPMEVRLGGDAEPVRLSIARIPRLVPTLAAISVLGALGAEIDASGAQSLDLKLALDLGDQGTLAMEQSFDGQGAPLAAAIHIFAVTGYLLQNRLAEVEIRSIDVELTTHLKPRTLRLVAAHPSRSVVSPGDKLSLNVDLAAYRGDKLRRELEVAVPSSVAAGRYILLVGDGYSIDAVRLGIEQSEPQTLPQALRFLNSLHSRRQLRVLGVVESPGLSVSGEVLPNLPGSVLSLWAASGAGGARPLRMAVAEEVGTILDRPVEGLLRIDLEIKRRQPVLGAEAGGAPGSREQTGSTGEPRDRKVPSSERRKPKEEDQGGDG